MCFCPYSCRNIMTGSDSDVSPDAPLLIDHGAAGPVAVDAAPGTVRVMRYVAHSRMMVVMVMVRSCWQHLLVVVVFFLWLGRKAHFDDGLCCAEEERVLVRFDYGDRWETVCFWWIGTAQVNKRSTEIFVLGDVCEEKRRVQFEGEASRWNLPEDLVIFMSNTRPSSSKCAHR